MSEDKALGDEDLEQASESERVSATSKKLSIVSNKAKPSKSKSQNKGETDATNAVNIALTPDPPQQASSSKNSSNEVGSSKSRSSVKYSKDKVEDKHSATSSQLNEGSSAKYSKDHGVKKQSAASSQLKEGSAKKISFAETENKVARSKKVTFDETLSRKSAKSTDIAQNNQATKSEKVSRASEKLSVAQEETEIGKLSLSSLKRSTLKESLEIVNRKLSKSANSILAEEESDIFSKFNNDYSREGQEENDQEEQPEEHQNESQQAPGKLMKVLEQLTAADRKYSKASGNNSSGQENEDKPRKKSLGLTTTAASKKMSILSSLVFSSDYGRKSIYTMGRKKACNTYQLGPDPKKRFTPRKVLESISKIVEKSMELMPVYEPELASKIARLLAIAVRDDTVEQKYDRYRIVTSVTIGQKLMQGANIDFRCLWDKETDDYEFKAFHKETYFVLVICFGIYRD